MGRNELTPLGGHRRPLATGLDTTDLLVLEALTKGASTASISALLDIPSKEVLARLRSLRREFGVRNNLALAASVARAGLI